MVVSSTRHPTGQTVGGCTHDPRHVPEGPRTRMTTGRHSKRLSLVPRGLFRWVLTLTGAWSLIASAAEGGPRYERVVLASLSFVLAAAGTLPGDFRPTARRLVFGLMTLFFVLAGVL